MVCWPTVRVTGIWVSLLARAVCVGFVLVLLGGVGVSLGRPGLSASWPGVLGGGSASTVFWPLVVLRWFFLDPASGVLRVVTVVPVIGRFASVRCWVCMWSRNSL